MKTPKKKRRLTKQNLSTQVVEDSPEARGVAVTLYEAPPPKRRTRKEIVEAVCLHIVQGTRLHVACHAEGITWRDLWMWKAQDAELFALYARAREASAESWEDQGTRTIFAAAADDNPQLARYREDHCRWRAKVANPRVYGDKVDLTTAGARIGLEELVAGSMEKKPT